jgi:hypothetical protein
MMNGNQQRSGEVRAAVVTAMATIVVALIGGAITLMINRDGDTEEAPRPALSTSPPANPSSGAETPAPSSEEVTPSTSENPADASIEVFPLSLRYASTSGLSVEGKGFQQNELVRIMLASSDLHDPKQKCSDFTKPAIIMTADKIGMVRRHSFAVVPENFDEARIGTSYVVACGDSSNLFAAAQIVITE